MNPCEFSRPWKVYGSGRIGPVSLEGSFAAGNPPTENQGITEETVAGDEKGWKGLMHLAWVDSNSLVDLHHESGCKKQVSSRNFHKKTRCTTFEGFLV